MNVCLAERVLLKHSNVNDLQRELLMLRSPILQTFEDIANLLRTLDRPEMLNIELKGLPRTMPPSMTPMTLR